MTAFTAASGGDHTMCVYTITHRASGRLYVGQTVNMAKRRWSDHCANKPSESPTFIKSTLAKYGRESFDFSVIDIADCQEQLDHKERFWIKHLNCLAPNGFNLDLGGKRGGKIMQATKEKIRKSVKEAFKKDPTLITRCMAGTVGRVPTEHQRMAQSLGVKAAHKNDPTLSLRKSLRAKGVARTDEVRRRIARTLTGVQFSPERCAAISKGMNPLSMSQRVETARARYKGRPIKVNGVVYQTAFELEIGTGLPADQVLTAIRRGSGVVKGTTIEVMHA